MTNNITMTHTGGPYGDECSTYDFVLSREMTLQEFVEMVASDERNWGYIYYGNHKLVDYKWGQIKYMPNVYKDIIIHREGKTSGGWSRMDYFIKIGGNSNG